MRPSNGGRPFSLSGTTSNMDEGDRQRRETVGRADPLVPYPITSASGRSIRSLLADPDKLFHPDGIEAFNPTVAGTRWGARAPRFVEEMGVAALASSDSHRAEDVGQAFTMFEGTTA